MKDCIFCKIIKKEIPETMLYEDDKTIAFLDIAPASPRGGHTLVIPKKHYEVISEMSDDDAKALMLSVKKLSKALLKFGEGLNVVQNNKKVAGQFVPHVHFHLIPRFEKDGIILGQPGNHRKYPDQKEKGKIINKIKSLL